MFTDRIFYRTPSVAAFGKTLTYSEMIGKKRKKNSDDAKRSCYY